MLDAEECRDLLCHDARLAQQKKADVLRLVDNRFQVRRRQAMGIVDHDIDTQRVLTELDVQRPSVSMPDAPGRSP
ncbi:hypothetical protein I6F33_35080 [Bradyrhizobium sp. BRP20]|uniref:hypothetical protein n=1 Tax=unclassified Bradyrhizobium TaxID=2631580 RepID=UPI001CD4C9C3|nr:hypothetical protein [Bradyrhizobium sp. BRP20]MCA1472291.1 hypothetical protein [Bradyrhizobium sp. IC3195]MCA1499236.1 hypothetical protein [Bradyrhizobium sp. NBAIM14]MCA1550684.1 hypothetical protein [Bradyrhizobium sp. BRP19]